MKEFVISCDTLNSPLVIVKGIYPKLVMCTMKTAAAGGAKEHIPFKDSATGL